LSRFASLGLECLSFLLHTNIGFTPVCLRREPSKAVNLAVNPTVNPTVDLAVNLAVNLVVDLAVNLAVNLLR
jgi:hypothetical protein